MRLLTTSALVLATASGAAFAAPGIGTIDPNNACNLAAWKITGATPSQNPAVPVQFEPINATGCVGVYAAGNDGPLLNPSPNLGYAGDGLLNGAGGFNPLAFISASQLQGIQDPNKLVDPGWIMLGKMDADKNNGAFQYADVQLANGQAYSLGNVLDFVISQDYSVGGKWTLTIDPNIVQIFSAIDLFSRSAFDHLAFTVKAGNGWAVYDFDFNMLGGFDLNVPYTLTGTWTTDGDFENHKGDDQKISHMSVWARDPIRAQAEEVPEPASLALVGLALVGLAAARRRRA